MSKIKRCERCNGSKIMMTLGMLQKKCNVCNGVGHQEVVSDEDVDSFLKPKRAKKTQEKNEGE